MRRAAAAAHIAKVRSRLASSPLRTNAVSSGLSASLSRSSSSSANSPRSSWLALFNFFEEAAANRQQQRHHHHHHHHHNVVLPVLKSRQTASPASYHAASPGGLRQLSTSASLKQQQQRLHDEQANAPAADHDEHHRLDKQLAEQHPTAAQSSENTSARDVAAEAEVAAKKAAHPQQDLIAHVSSFPRSLRQLALSLPSASLRRPTKDELLAGTTSFLERLRIRFKWFTIRGFRRFRADDWSAFVSWIVGGVGVWIVLGTTSFVSALFFLANSLQMQEWMAAKLGSYLTSQSGVTVIFESAIVPRFSLRDSRITFKNVYISRGMASDRYADDDLHDRHPEEIKEVEGPPSSPSSPSSRSKGSKSRVRRMSGGELADIRSRDTREDQHRRQLAHVNQEMLLATPEDTLPQYTHFHLTIDSIEVALSLPRWLDGKGLVKDAKVKGVRGVIDRSHLKFSEADQKLDYRRFRHTSQPGDFQLESLEVEDFLATIYQPNDFRPYAFSIFQANVGSLRKQWLFYDLLSADSITGQLDNCLFSLHKPQSIGRTSEHDMQDSTWKRMSRFRIDGVPIDHLQSPADKGPLSWILSGRADLVADIRFPRGPEDDVDLNTILGDIVDNLDEALRTSAPTSSMVEGSDRIPGQRALTKGQPLEAPSVSLRSMLGIEGDPDKEKKRRVVCMRLDIRFRDVKAAVPLFPDDLSSVNNALVRPIVAFLNANRTLIPIRCHVDIDLDEFDGSWTSYDIGLLDAIAEQVYNALANHVQESNGKRVKAVGLWTLQKSAAAILLALKDNLDHL